MGNDIPPPPASTLPRLVIDTREQCPLEFLHLPSKRAALQSGDYSAEGLQEAFAVERKSLPDLAASLTRERERFMRELHRLRGFPCAYLLVVGDDRELARLVAQGRMNLKQAEHSLLSIATRYRVHVQRAATPEQAAVLVETWAFCAWREALKPMGGKLPFPDWAASPLLERRWA